MPYRKREVGEKWCVEVEKDGRWERVKCYTGSDAEERAEKLRTALHLAVFEEEQKAIPAGVAASIEAATTAALRKKLTDVMSRLWSEGLAGAVGIVRGTVGDRDAPMTDPADLSDIFSGTVGERITMIEDTTRDRIRRYVRRANEEGYSVNKLAKMIREDSSEAFGRSRARTIARTESGMVYNLGSLEGYRQSGITKVKVLDNEGPNSCKECARVNGQTWDIDKAIAEPLEHPNCVRAFRPIVSSRYGGRVRPEGAERPVPPNMPPEYGRRLRGEGEAEARQGGVTLKDKWVRGARSLDVSELDRGDYAMFDELGVERGDWRALGRAAEAQYGYGAHGNMAQAAYEHTRDVVDPPQWKRGKRRFLRFYDDDGREVGCLDMVELVDPDEGRNAVVIDYLSTTKDAPSGTGLRALSEAARWAEEKGATTIELDSLDSAKGFYKKMGGRQTLLEQAGGEDPGGHLGKFFEWDEDSIRELAGVAP